ncbi:MAG: DUF115 domain-containing protein [Treponema sp.]|jgi:hypothetical protein|nr:DUF115 domain-containing protein [Treponema sp.]
MDKQYLFERNLLSLSLSDPELCSRLTAAETTRGRYKFLTARSGDPVPALVDAAGAAHPLHSLVDPEKEGRRLVSTVAGEGVLVFFGLGGGYHIEAALEREDIYRVLVVDYDLNGIAELLSSQEYIRIFNDFRFRLLADISPAALETYLPQVYQPVLYGGIRLLPLRTRTAPDNARFNAAGDAVARAIERVKGDYSVQAYFGKRWFANSIRNLFRAEGDLPPIPPIRHAAVSAAGPSLDRQIPELIRQRDSLYLIATDTSLPSLLAAGVEPDAVVSIDCQHISYYHFMGGLPAHIPLFLDLASPPTVAACSKNLRFFSGGHPLTRYISQAWRSFPAVDTSGGNVTYAALSLADTLGARRIDLYGADFSYPQGMTYARGAYLSPYFDKKQSRFAPTESLFSDFLYRSPSLRRMEGGGSWYYETNIMGQYREGLEEKARVLGTVRAVPGMGPPLDVEKKSGVPRPAVIRLFSTGPAAMSAGDFLVEYQKKIRSLPPIRNGPEKFTEDERRILATLLPTGAAIKRRRPDLRGAEVLEEIRAFCLEEIDRLLGPPADKIV